MPGVAQRLQAERERFPGMLPREIVVFRAWLRLHEAEYDRFDYNMRIGAGNDPGPTYDETTRRMAIANSQKRIDAVGYKGLDVTIIEVKDRAQASAIGQLVTYDAIWRQDHATERPPTLLLVTNRLAPDLIPVLQRSGIRLELVEADFGELRRQK